MKQYNTQTHRFGFTIVELLVIIVVIAILVSITVVSYAMITDNAKHKTVETDAQGIAVYLNKYKADHGSYPATLDLLDSKPKAESTFQYSYDATNNTYCVTASVTGASAYVQSGNSTAKEGGCPGHGVDGEEPITNLASNPSAETNCDGVSGYFSAPLTTCPTTGGAVSGTKIFSTVTNSATNGQGLIHTITTSAKGNQQYTCSISLKGTNGSAITFSGRPATAANGYISEGLGAKAVTLTSTWQRVSITFTSPSTTGILRVQYRLNAPASGVTIQSDALLCTEGTIDYQYADGNTSNWVWSGAVNNSSSVGPAL